MPRRRQVHWSRSPGPLGGAGEPAKRWTEPEGVRPAHARAARSETGRHAPHEFVYTVLGNLFFQRAKIHQRRAEPEEEEIALETALGWQRKMPPNHELAKLLRELAELGFFKRQ